MTEQQRITDPGLYSDVPEDDYHSGAATSFESLSCSDCKLLAKPGGPALWHWQQSHPEPPKRVFDIGSAVHAAILGTGPDLVCVPGEWRSKAVKEEVDQWRQKGAIPLHRSDYRAVFGMVGAVTRHPLAASLLDECPRREASAYVGHGDLYLRCRLDAIGPKGIVDLKTVQSADPEAFARKAIELGYHQQAAWYRDMAQELGITEGPFRFVAVEKTPPHLVSVIELDAATEQLGRDANQRAIDTYRRCVATDEWPGYDSQIATVSAPPWAFPEIDIEQEIQIS